MFRLGRCVPSKKKKFRSVWIMIGTCMSCLIDQIISLALLKLIRKVRQELFLYIIDQLANLTKMCQTSSSTLSKQHYRNCCKGFREVCLSIVGQPICILPARRNQLQRVVQIHCTLDFMCNIATCGIFYKHLHPIMLGLVQFNLRFKVKIFNLRCSLFQTTK